MYSLATYLLVGGFGIIIGSFINVLIARYQTGVGIDGRSRCLNCGNTLSAKELIPVLSFLIQKGRCRNCDAAISWQYPIVELLAAVYAIVILIAAPTAAAMVVYWLAGVPLLVIAVYDVMHYIIPILYARILLFLAVVFTVLGLVIEPLVIAQYPHTIAVALALMLFFYSLWLFSDGAAMGFGDVGLVLSLGLLFPYPINIVGAVFSFWLGAAVGIYLLWRSKSHRTLKSEVPFGPFLVAGFILALLVVDLFPNILLVV